MKGFSDTTSGTWRKFASAQNVIRSNGILVVCYGEECVLVDGKPTNSRQFFRLARSLGWNPEKRRAA